MKFQVTMKDPDTLSDAIDEAVHKSMRDSPALSDSEREAAEEVRANNVRGLCMRWFRYSECLTVEIDTDKQTCTVLPVE